MIVNFSRITSLKRTSVHPNTYPAFEEFSFGRHHLVKVIKYLLIINSIIVIIKTIISSVIDLISK